MSEKAEKHIRFDVQLNEKDLYGFNMYQIYSGVHGWVSILIGVFAIAAGIFGFANITGNGNQTNSVLYILGGIVIMAYIPLTMKGKIKYSLKVNESLSQPLSYDISENGIAVSRGEESAQLPWDMIYKMVGNSKRVLIYSSRVNAYVIPHRYIEKEYPEIMELAKEKLPSYRYRMK